MRGKVAAFALIATALVWAWALLGAGPPPELPEPLRGRFEVFAFEPAPGSEESPLAPNQTLVYEFLPDCTYTLRVLLDGATEMARFGGTVVPAGPGGPGGNDEIVMTGVSENARAMDGASERYRVIWAYDEHGEYLNLTQLTESGEEGRQLFLRKQP